MNFGFIQDILKILIALSLSAEEWGADVINGGDVFHKVRKSNIWIALIFMSL